MAEVTSHLSKSQVVRTAKLPSADERHGSGRARTAESSPSLVPDFHPSYMMRHSGWRPSRTARREDKTMPSAHETIDAEVKSNDVVLFMKGTPQFPMCGFSGQCVQILDYLGVPYKGVNVLEDAELRQGIKEYTNWPTIPQLYVKGEFVGGCDIVREMFQSGELATHMSDAGLPVKAAAAG